MNHDDLIHRFLEGRASPDDTSSLSLLIETDQAVRARYLDLAELHAALMADETLRSHTSAQRTDFPKVSRWQQWRPLTAAAAGLLLGCFSTSMVWALNTHSWADGIRRMLLPLGNPGFERQEALPQVHLVPKIAQWSGLDTEIVEGGGTRPMAKAGQRMIRLGPAPEGKGYFANVMADLAMSRPLTDKPLQIEVTAHYHASKSGQGEHYSLNAATFAGDSAVVSRHWENTWRDMRDASLTNTGKAIFPTATENGWQTITIRLDVPPQARTLVISMGSNTPGPIAGRTDHFMDEVSATWVLSEKTPLP